MGASRSGMHMQLADRGAFACLCTRRMLLLHSAPMLVLALCKYMNNHCCNSMYRIPCVLQQALAMINMPMTET